MKELEEYKKLKKQQMVVSLIEIMVQQGWDITNFVYNFKAYKKFELINRYSDQLNYAKRTA